MRIVLRKPVLFAGMAVALSACATAAHAKNDDSASVVVEATVAPRCQLAAGERDGDDTARIDRPTRIALGFSLDCNTPFRIGMSSRNGAMQLSGVGGDATSDDGFAVRMAYQVGLSFDTDARRNFSAGTCSSDTLSATSGTCAFYAARAGQGISPGERETAINRTGQITVEWRGEDADAPESGVRLAAGEFTDTITLVVGPRT